MNLVKKYTLIVIYFIFVQLKSYSQEKTTPILEEEEIIEEPAKISENPFADMNAWGENKDGVGGGFMSSTNLEFAMTNQEIDSSVLKRQDTLVRYDVVLDNKINLNGFELKGLWKIVYKEVLDTRIVPIKSTYNQKTCLDDTILFALDYFYGATTCMRNLFFFDPKEIAPKNIDVKTSSVVKDEDYYSGALKNEKDLNEKSMLLLLKTYYYALYERLGSQILPTIQLNANQLNGMQQSMNIYVLNSNLIAMFHGRTLLYFERILEHKKEINYDDPIEINQQKISWKKDQYGYSMVFGRDLNEFNFFIPDVKEDRTNKRESRVHIIFYPPKIGNNKLVIYNIAPNKKGEINQTFLYDSEGTINAVKQIFIPMSKLKSTLLGIDFSSLGEKKYAWGMKYKIQTKY